MNREIYRIQRQKENCDFTFYFESAKKHKIKHEIYKEGEITTVLSKGPNKCDKYSVIKL